MRKEQLKIGQVDIEVTFKPIKNLHLSVHPPKGHVTIASPEFYDLEKVKIYAATKLAWIKKEQRKFREQSREEPRLYVNRESHYLFGERYLLKLIGATKNKVQPEGKRLTIYTKNTNDKALLEKQLYAYYRNELRRRLQVMIEKYAKQMDIEVPAFKIRKMKTKWGSCATHHSRIWFNIELAKKPLDCIEYIVVHELVHLLERNHNKRFIALMDQFLINWRLQKKY